MERPGGKEEGGGEDCEMLALRHHGMARDAEMLPHMLDPSCLSLFCYQPLCIK